MAAISSGQAVALARAKINTGAAAPARAFLVRRLDRPGAEYYLILFGADNATTGVVTVGADMGDIQAWADLPGLAPQLPLQEAEAIQKAGLPDVTSAALVWQPCTATRSPLYPLWEIRATAKTVYVDQRGTVWPKLFSGGPGG